MFADLLYLPTLQRNTFEGILITDGDSTSYAVFIYRCGDINWSRDNSFNFGVVGYRAVGSLFETNPASSSDDVLMLGCNNNETHPWENLIYRLSAGK